MHWFHSLYLLWYSASLKDVVFVWLPSCSFVDTPSQRDNYLTIQLQSFYVMTDELLRNFVTNYIEHWSRNLSSECSHVCVYIHVCACVHVWAYMVVYACIYDIHCLTHTFHPETSPLCSPQCGSVGNICQTQPTEGGEGPCFERWGCCSNSEEVS